MMDMGGICRCLHLEDAMVTILDSIGYRRAVCADDLCCAIAAARVVTYASCSKLSQEYAMPGYV